MKRNRAMKVLSMVLTLCMLITMMPLTVSAAGPVIVASPFYTGAVNPSTYVSINDTVATFGEGAADASNWTFDFGTTGLTVESIVPQVIPGQPTNSVQINFSGTAQEGTLTITAKAATFSSGTVDSESATILVTNPSSGPTYDTSFVPGSGGSMPAFTEHNSEPYKISGLYVYKSDRESNYFSGGTRPVVELQFKAPEVYGADSYTLQYSSDNGSTWQSYMYLGAPVTTGSSTVDNFCIYPDGSYQYRLLVNGGDANGFTSNQVDAPISSVNTYFSNWNFDESMYIGNNVMTPFAGCGKTAAFEAKNLSDNTTASGITYQWYRVNPVTYGMDEIAGATGTTYISTEADAGYLLLCRGTGDGTSAGGFIQVMSDQTIVIPDKAYVTNVSATGFRLNLYKSIDGLSPSDLRIYYFDSQYQEVNLDILAVTPVDDNNSIYDISVNIPAGVYDLNLTSRAYFWSIGTQMTGMPGYHEFMPFVPIKLPVHPTTVIQADALNIATSEGNFNVKVNTGMLPADVQSFTKMTVNGIYTNNAEIISDSIASAEQFGYGVQTYSEADGYNSSNTSPYNLVMFMNDSNIVLGYAIIVGPLSGGGTARIDEIFSWEDNSQVSLNGQQLYLYNPTDVRAELWLGSTKLADSDEVKYMDGHIDILFYDWYAKIDTNYTLKLFVAGQDKSSELPSGGVFTTIPLLGCDDAVTNASEGSTLTINDRNDLWTAGQQLNAYIHGPSIAGYEESTGANLVVNEGSIVFKLTSGEGRTLPLEPGEYEIYIHDQATGARLGRAFFYVGTTIKGTVRNAANTENVGSGAVTIYKVENDGKWSWNRGILTQPDGNFYLSKFFTPGDGNYVAVASPLDNSTETSGYTYFSISGDVISPDHITVQLQTPNVSGVVKLPDGTNPGSVSIEVFDANNKSILRDRTDSNGAFKLKLDNAGQYFVKAYTDDRLLAIESEPVSITYDGINAVSGIEVYCQTPQFTVTAKSPTGDTLLPDQYNIWIDSVDVQGEWNYNTSRYQDNTLLGGLRKGTYKVRVAPNGSCQYSQSLSEEVAIDENGNSSQANLTLQMTTPKLHGYVNGLYGQNYWEARVQVMKKGPYGYDRVTDVPVQNEYGEYRIGGLPDGQYYIRAVLWQGSQLKGIYGSSQLVPVTLGVNTIQDLNFGDKTPRVVSVDYAAPGYDRLWTRIINVSSISSVDNLKAEITDEYGNSLTPKYEITGGQNFTIHYEWRDFDNDETGLEITLPDKLNLPVGKYQLKITDMKDPGNTADDVVLLGDLPDSVNLKVLHNINMNPFGVYPNTADQKIKIEANDGSQLWSQGDLLNVVLYDKESVEIPVTAYTIGTDGVLEVTLPSLISGHYDIRISKDGEILAQQGFDVGMPAIEMIQGMTETDRTVYLKGTNLSVLSVPTTKAKVFDQNNQVVAVSENVWNFWGNLAIDISNSLPAGNYTLKVWNGEETDANLVAMPNAGQLKVINSLIAEPGVVLDNYTDTTVTLHLRQGSAACWNIGDTLKLELINDIDGYENAITIQPSSITADSISFILPTAEAQRLKETHWYVDVNKVNTDTSEEFVASAQFDVVNPNNFAFTGIIKNQQGTPILQSGMKIYLDNWDNDKHYSFTTNAQGQYSAYWIEPGTYRIHAEPADGQLYMGSEESFITIGTDGKLQGSTTKDFTLVEARTISGTISLPGGVTADKDINMWIGVSYYNNTPESDDDWWNGIELKIPQGRSSVSYILFVPKDASRTLYNVSLWADSNSGYISNYYYGTGGVRYSEAEASNVDVSAGNKDNINFQLVEGKTISGTVFAPTGYSIPEEGIGMSVVAIITNGTEDKRDDYVFGTKTLIDQTGAGNYVLNVPDNYGNGYVVMYQTDTDSDPFAPSGYYSTSGTTYDMSQATPVDVISGNQSGINLTIDMNYTATRAGMIRTIIEGMGSSRFVQPTAADIAGYEAAFTDWNMMTQEEKAAMAIALKNSIVVGTDASHISPKALCHRSEAAALLCRIANVLGVTLPVINENVSFTDINDHWAKNMILTLAKADIVHGYPDGRFAPNGFITPDQMNMLVQNFKSVVDNSIQLPQLIGFTLSGVSQVGQTLTVTNPIYSVAIPQTTPAFTYQWFRDTDNDKNNGMTQISGANGQSYTLTPEDEGKYIHVIVTASGSAIGSKGAYSTTAVMSSIAKKLTVTSASARPGETVELDINLEQGSGAMTGEFLIDFDTSKLTPDSYTIGSLIQGSNPGVVFNYVSTGKVKVQWAGTEGTTAGGSVIRIKFIVNQNAQNNDIIPVTLTNVVLGDQSAQQIPCQAVAGNVTVTTIMAGDVNQDGLVDSGDAVLVLRHGLGSITLTGDQFKAADVNNDNVVNTMDAGQILRYDAGLSSILD